MDKKICVIGGGRWGKNHIRTLAGLGCLAAVVEADAVRLKEYTEQYPGIKGYADMDEAIACGYDGYTVALPAELHYPAGRKLLEKGLNVMLEKPMTLTAAQSAELVELAQRTGARLMVGHVLLFHPAYRKIKEVIDSGRLGKLFYLYSNRLNLGTVRTEESVFPSFAPHDISVLDYPHGRFGMQDRGERSEVSPGQGVRQYAGATGISRQRACPHLRILASSLQAAVAGGGGQ